MTKLSKTISDLRESFQAWPPTRLYVDWARDVEDTPEATATKELSELLELKPVDAKELFDGIVKLGLAERIVGRRTHPSRLKWRYTLRSIAAVAMGEADDFEPVGRSLAPVRKPATPLIEYVFQLRRDLKIRLSLPADFSKQDIVRLTAFLETLPLGSDE
jgi:hypothetical protein